MIKMMSIVACFSMLSTVSVSAFAADCSSNEGVARAAAEYAETLSNVSGCSADPSNCEQVNHRAVDCTVNCQTGQVLLIDVDVLRNGQCGEIHDYVDRSRN